MFCRERCQIIIPIYQQEKKINFLTFLSQRLLFKQLREMKKVNREPSALGAGNKGGRLAGAR